MKELRAGVVGMGVMGMLHAGILNSIENVKVSAVVDTEKFIVNFLQNTTEIKVYDNYKKMLNDSELDLVYITTPVNSHIEIASYCAKNRLHFFIEKPLGRNASECELLVKIIKEHPVVNMIGFYLRYSSTFLKAKEFLDKKALGEIKGIKSTVFRSLQPGTRSGWRFNKTQSGGGVLLDLGIHAIDLLSWYFGSITAVQGSVESNDGTDIEDSVTTSLRFENDIDCSLEASWNVKNHRIQETTIEVEGSLARLKVNEDYLKIEYNNSDGKKDGVTLYRQSLYRGVGFDIGGPEYTREDVDFINYIRTEKQSELNVINSTRLQTVIDHIYKSSKTHRLEEVEYHE